MSAELDRARARGGSERRMRSNLGEGVYVPRVVYVPALSLAGNCYSKCRESRTHTQLFLPHTLPGTRGGGRVRSPISDVSNPDNAPACQLPVAAERAECRRPNQEGAP